MNSSLLSKIDSNCNAWMVPGNTARKQNLPDRNIAVLSKHERTLSIAVFLIVSMLSPHICWNSGYLFKVLRFWSEFQLAKSILLITKSSSQLCGAGLWWSRLKYASLLNFSVSDDRHLSTSTSLPIIKNDKLQIQGSTALILMYQLLIYVQVDMVHPRRGFVSVGYTIRL